MSLVAYGSSDDDSENEDEVSSTSMQTISKKLREPVKITIPSLTEFKEVSTPETAKKFTPQGGLGGLFSMLPPPKSSAAPSQPGFTPYVFSKKKEVKKAVPRIPNPPKETAVPLKNSDPTPALESVEPDSSITDDPTDSTEKVDFFSLGTNASLPVSTSSLNCVDTYPVAINDIPLPHSSTSVSSTCEYSSEGASSSTAASYEVYNSAPVSEPGPSFSGAAAAENFVSTAEWAPTFSEASEGNCEPAFFQDEGFLKLKGKRRKEEINIIDVKADDQLTGKDAWLMQSLTEEKVQRPSKRRHDMPTTQQKRKHQITYLAFQAKERELDLKNQWAHNSRTKRETQAKYGF